MITNPLKRGANLLRDATRPVSKPDPGPEPAEPEPVHSDALGTIRTQLEISELRKLESPEKDGESTNSPPKKSSPELHNARLHAHNYPPQPVRWPSRPEPNTIELGRT